MDSRQLKVQKNMFTTTMRGNFILVSSYPLRLVRIFPHVGRVLISFGFLPTRFSLILLQNCITAKKGDISSSILEKNSLDHQKAPKKLHIRYLNGGLNILVLSDHIIFLWALGQGYL